MKVSTLVHVDNFIAIFKYIINILINYYKKLLYNILNYAAPYYTEYINKIKFMILIYEIIVVKQKVNLEKTLGLIVFTQK